MARFESDPHLRAEFLKLQLQFLSNASRDVGEIVELLDSSIECNPTTEAGKRLRQLSHGLRGAGGSYGFNDVTTTAGELEEACLSTASPSKLREAAQALERAVLAAREQLEQEGVSA